MSDQSSSVGGSGSLARSSSSDSSVSTYVTSAAAATSSSSVNGSSVMPSTVQPLPGYLHEHSFRTTNVVELKVACADHGTWHTYPLQGLYRAGTRIRRPHSHHRGEFLLIEIQAERFDPRWQAHADHRHFTPAYARAVARSAA